MRFEPRPYLSLTLANLRMLLRNPVATFSIFIVLLVLLGFLRLVADQNVQTKVMVIDQSAGGPGGALVADIRRLPGFDVRLASRATADRGLRQGDVDLVVTVPPDVGRADASGHVVPVTLVAQYRAGSRGESAIPVLRGVVQDFDERVLHVVPPVSIAAAAVQGRATGVIDVLLPGVVTFNIIGSALMVAAGIFSGYKSTGVLRRLKATGIAPSTFVLAHATSTLLAGLVQTGAIVVVAALLYQIHIDVPALLVLIGLGYLVFLALGLAISGWVRDPQRATAVSQSVAFPMILIALLSVSLPPSLSAVTRYLPVSYVVDGVQHVNQGGGLESVGTDALWLGGWALVLLVAASRAFRWD